MNEIRQVEQWFRMNKAENFSDWEEAIKLFTIWPAIAAFQDNIKGTIEKGKLADFTVFNKDLMAIPVEEILNSKNILTIVGGKIVYKDL